MAPSPRSRCRAPAAAVTGLLFQGEALATHAAIQVGCPTSQDKSPFASAAVAVGPQNRGVFWKGIPLFAASDLW